MGYGVLDTAAHRFALDQRGLPRFRCICWCNLFQGVEGGTMGQINQRHSGAPNKRVSLVRDGVGIDRAEKGLLFAMPYSCRTNDKGHQKVP